ncbi:MAG: hypothetical protein AAF409_12405 [Pseudomonadota bacterium]
MDVKAADSAWRAEALRIVSAVMFGLLLTFAVRNLLADQLITGVLTAAGLPLVAITFSIARRRRESLPWWAPYPMVVHLVAVLVVSTFVESVGQGASLMWYGAAPALVILTMGSRAGLIVSLGLIAVMVLALLTIEHRLPFDYALRLCVGFLLTCCVLYSYAYERERASRALERAAARIDALEGMLSICGWCHKWMRDETGEWVSTEQFFEDRAPVQFSHGLCPSCAARLESAEVRNNR